MGDVRWLLCQSVKGVLRFVIHPWSTLSAHVKEAVLVNTYVTRLFHSITLGFHSKA